MIREGVYLKKWLVKYIYLKKYISFLIWVNFKEIVIDIISIVPKT